VVAKWSNTWDTSAALMPGPLSATKRHRRSAWGSSKTLILTVRDQAHNQATSPTWQFTVDTVAPSIAGLTPEELRQTIAPAI